MLRINLGNGVEQLWRCIRAGVGGQAQAIKSHAFFQGIRKGAAGREEHPLLVIVAKGIFRLQVQLQGIAHSVALQGLVDAGEQIIAAHQKLHRRLQHIQHLAQSVF